MPTLRPLVPATEAGIEISLIRTNTVASAPSATVISGAGAAAGNSSPNRCRRARQMTATPIRKTNLPSVPLFHPVTDRVGPSTDWPEYQLVNA